MGLFPSIVASRMLLKTQFSPAAVFPSRVAFAVGFYLDDVILLQWVVPQSCLLAELFVSQLILRSPADIRDFLLFPNRFVLVAVLPVVTFCTLIGLFPNISDSLLLQQYLQIFALQHVDLRRLAFQLVFPLEV